ncbi:peptidylprolyl isomerase [Chloroflexota bacterium]
MNKAWQLTSLVFLVVVTLTLISCISEARLDTNPSPMPTKTPTPENTSGFTPSPTKGESVLQWHSPPSMDIDRDRQYMAIIKTNFGDIEFQLFPQDAPLAVNNFVFLARQGFFDGVKVHRVKKGYVIQSGDPTGTGYGGPGYTFAAEPVTRDYVAGILAMANRGPNTNGSQFFITLADLSSVLPKNYTIFGQVTRGFDVVQTIENVPVRALFVGGEVSSPTVDVHIDTVIIEER